MLTEGLGTEEIIALAAGRAEFPWHWGTRIWDNERIKQAADDLGVDLFYGEPIRPGNMYFGMRNTGPHLLTCRTLAEACVYPTTVAYPFNFNECVLVRERQQS